MTVTGHAKNVANFETVIIVLDNLGAIYNPTQTLIQPAALQAKLTDAKNALDAFAQTDAARKIVIDERAAEFSGLREFAVNVKRMATVEINDKLFLADLQSLVRKFRGERAGKKPVDDPATPDIDESQNTRSVSQRSFDSLTAHFAALVALLKAAKPPYQTNDDEMKIPALEAKLARLRAKNAAVQSANAELGAATDIRDAVLYDDTTGIIKLVKLIKAQLARKPGTDSAAYKQVVALEFRKF